MAKVQRSAVEFFNASGEDYARAYAADTPPGYALRIRRKKVLDLFDKPGGSVLDVGCGPAPMAEDLLQLGCKFWGADPSNKMIEMCRERWGETENTHFVLSSATELPFPHSFFDAVLCIGVTDSMPDVSAGIQKMLDVLKPGGTLIISFSNMQSPYAWWRAFVFYRAVSALRRVFGLGRGHDRFSENPHLYTASQARELLNQLGVGVEAQVGYYFNVALSPLDEWFPRAALRVTRHLEESRRAVPSWVPAGYLFRARKASA